MATQLTVFQATLVQDSAMTVAGLDQSSTSDRPFTVIDGKPVLMGSGIRGAAVAMARRFFDPLPRSISEPPDSGTALTRSCWEFSPTTTRAEVELRVGVGILQKTGARAQGVLHDREVVPAGTRWTLTIRVDWTRAPGEAKEAEGILGYVLQEHWAQGRCWLGGDVARGAGWCHLEDLQAYQLDEAAWRAWIDSGRTLLPEPVTSPPTSAPTRSWSFRTRDINISFGEYRPAVNDTAWGVDMFAVGPHDLDRSQQPLGDGTWASPSWPTSPTGLDAVDTNRAIVMSGDRPLLPGSSLRGPLRHAMSRAVRTRGDDVRDPHDFNGDVGRSDPVGGIFGTVDQSATVLVRDAVAEQGWSAARLEMHAEDEFSAGSYGTAKRNAVRLLSGTFRPRIVVEGPSDESVDKITSHIDRLIELGVLGHLPIGADKTRGAGWTPWTTAPWEVFDARADRTWQPTTQPSSPATHVVANPSGSTRSHWVDFRPESKTATTVLLRRNGDIPGDLTLGAAILAAREALDGAPEAWWCEPTIDFSVTAPPQIFGSASWPSNEDLKVDEVFFFWNSEVWRAARTTSGSRWVHHREADSDETGAEQGRMVEILKTPVRLHNDSTRFAAAATDAGRWVIHEWMENGVTVSFTLTRFSGKETQ